jgi:hypothetical protein
MDINRSVLKLLSRKKYNLIRDDWQKDRLHVNLRDSPSCLFLPLNPSLIASFMMLIVPKQKKKSGGKNIT